MDTLQISFHALKHSDAISEAIRKKAEQLERFFPRITSVRVRVEPATRRHQQGSLYQVRITMSVPGSEIAVSRYPSEHQAHEDVYVAIRDAFKSARRQLEDYVRSHFKARKKKREEAHSKAQVAQLYFEPGASYGFLRTKDGREVFFHQNSVTNGDFDKLQVGDDVRFTEEVGEKGPQASTVYRIARPNHATAKAS